MDRLLPNGKRPNDGKENGKKSKFTEKDDERLLRFVRECGFPINWRSISNKMRNRSPRQCRERYNNYINPSLNNLCWTKEEDEILLLKYGEIGSKWNAIGQLLPGKSTNAIKNRLSFLKKPKKPGEKEIKLTQNSEETKINGDANEEPHDSSDSYNQIFDNIFDCHADIDLFGEIDEANVLFKTLF